MAGSKRQADDDQTFLFDIGEPRHLEPDLRRPDIPIWTEHKARLIERYLYYFVLITKHGAYIDGFAGPQEEVEEVDRWSAKLVIESEPRWLRKFFLFDMKAEQAERIRRMVASQPELPKNLPKRSFSVQEGDFNDLIPKMLASRPIKDNEATFALLDQRTFECEWRSVEALARYKPATQPRIELFYFLPNHWLDRAMAATKNEAILRAWWGRGDWAVMRGKSGFERARLMSERIRELGYASVKAWPIKQREEGGGATMYSMIHATDHPEAPKLMDRAYRRVLKPREENVEQTSLEALLAMPDDD